MKTALKKTLLAALLLTIAAGAMAQERRGDHRPDPRFNERTVRSGDAMHPYQGLMRLDDRYRHGRYYPAAGQVVVTLPFGSVPVNFRGLPFYFQGGVWMRPVGRRFVVVAPPVGALAPELPPGHVTLLIGAVPYYYANYLYYSHVPGQGYAVVPEPLGAEYAQVIPNRSLPPGAQPYPAPHQLPQVQTKPQPVPPHVQVLPDPVVYPRDGQSPGQTVADLSACRDWAGAQPAATGDASVYQRGIAACMDARGYSVR